MNKTFLQKVGLPLGVILLLIGTLFLVQCDIDHAQRDPLGQPILPGVDSASPPTVAP